MGQSKKKITLKYQASSQKEQKISPLIKRKSKSQKIVAIYMKLFSTEWQ